LCRQHKNAEQYTASDLTSSGWTIQGVWKRRFTLTLTLKYNFTSFLGGVLREAEVYAVRTWDKLPGLHSREKLLCAVVSEMYFGINLFPLQFSYYFFCWIRKEEKLKQLKRT